MNLPTIVAVTAGDPGGIGPEVCLAAARSGRVGSERLILFGDAEVFRRVGDRLHLAVPPAVKSLDEAIQHVTFGTDTAVIYDLQAVDADAVVPGEVSACTGKASYSYITASIDTALAGKVDAVATGPIHKEALKLAGVDFPGHTEIFATRTRSDRACMMLTSELTCSPSRYGLCCLHVPRPRAHSAEDPRIRHRRQYNAWLADHSYVR